MSGLGRRSGPQTFLISGFIYVGEKEKMVFTLHFLIILAFQYLLLVKLMDQHLNGNYLGEI